MNIKGKACSFCGAEAATPERHYHIRRQEWIETTACTNPNCPIWKQEMSIEDWNSLPDIASLLYQRDDAIGERNAYMKSYEGVCKERNILQEKLDLAMEALRDFQEGADFYMLNNEAKGRIEDVLAEIEKIK